MTFRFYLNDLEIEEPAGWADMELSMKRDEKYHGMQFEATTGTLRFYGVAAAYLMEQKAMYGVKANVSFIAEQACDTEYAEVFRGRLNFGRYKDTCGDLCEVTLPVEEDSCAVIFNSRFDQKVDMDSLTAFDGITGLPAYTNMGQEITIPAKALLLEDEANLTQEIEEELTANVGEWHTTTSPNTIQAMLFPAFNNTISSSFGIFTPSVFPDFYAGGNPQVRPDVPPTIDATTLMGSIECELADVTMEYRLKGHVYLEGSNSLASFQIQAWRLRGGVYSQQYIWNNPTPGPGGATLFVYLNDPAGWDIAGWEREMDFDVSDSITLDIQQGDQFWFFVRPFSSTFAQIDLLTWTQHAESYLKVSARAVCEDSQAKSYLIHESLSRAAEAVTNRCLRAYSEYYGRIDSQPFAFDTDGCGGLRMLTSGLKIRRAPEDKFFASPKDLIEGLNGIDNIGFGIEPDPEIAEKFVWRIEPVEHFYQDDEIAVHDAIPRAGGEVQESGYYSKVIAGYPNWEVEQVNGLGEPNSTREYRTGLETINNPLDIQSALVTGSYPIEVTRQQSFAETGAADTRYDNNIFLITLERGMYGFVVEQGNITNPDNIFDPATLLNFRLTPVRNLMRWYKSIINSYPNISNSEAKLFFSAGTGNLIAEGEITQGFYADPCKLENMVISESQNLFITHFADQDDATPLWQNETLTYEYPLSVEGYAALKARPYGYISAQCGDGDYLKGFIQEVKFKPARGIASFILKKKWVS